MPTTGSHRRPRLRRRVGRTRALYPRCAQCSHPAPQQTQRGPTRVRTPASIPQQDQMANRIRRAHQPSQAKLRLGPHRTDRHPWCPNLVRTRRLRPQPRQNRRARRMKPAPGQSPNPNWQSCSPPSHLRRVFQVEVARQDFLRLGGCLSNIGCGPHDNQLVTSMNGLRRTSFCQGAVQRRPADAEGIGNCAGRFSAGVHPLCQSNFFGSEGSWTTD